MRKQFKNNINGDIVYRSMYMVRTPMEKYRDCIGVVVITGKSCYSAFNACGPVKTSSLQNECNSMYFPVQFEI